MSGLAVSAAKVNYSKITTANLNLRKSSNTTSAALLVIPKNTTLAVTETNGKWNKVSFKGKTGWVSGAYLKNAPVQKPAPKVVHNYATTYTALFKNASEKSLNLGGLQRHTKVELVGKSGSFSKVKVSGKSGFILTKNLAAANPAVVSRWLKTTSPLFQTANSKSKKMTTLNQHAKVQWLRTSGTWQYVKTTAGSGWIQTSALSSTETKTPVAYRWTKANVNLRKGNSTSHASLGVVPNGEKVTYLKTSNGWSQVKSSKGTGWISNKYLANSNNQYPVAVYGTLRKGQTYYRLVKGKTTAEVKTKIASHSLFLQPDRRNLSYIVSSSNTKDQVVAERMHLKPNLYASTMTNLDAYERYDPSKSANSQNYNRKLVKDRDGNTVWAYVASPKVSEYLKQRGIRVTSGDYLKRF